MMTATICEKRMQPSLRELLNRYLNDPGQGEGRSIDALGMAEPYEVQGAFRPDAQQTWRDSTSVLKLFGLTAQSVALPPEWDAFTNLERTLPLMPMGMGLFPQRVSATTDWNGPLTNATLPVANFTQIRKWIDQTLKNDSPLPMLIASGIAATLGAHEHANRFIEAAKPHCQGDWQPVWQNQHDAIAFLNDADADGLFADDRNDAASRFNRGLLALCKADYASAQTELANAVGLIPESSSWHHLAKLYQSVAEMRGHSISS